MMCCRHRRANYLETMTMYSRREWDPRLFLSTSQPSAVDIFAVNATYFSFVHELRRSICALGCTEREQFLVPKLTLISFVRNEKLLRFPWVLHLSDQISAEGNHWPLIE